MTRYIAEVIEDESGELVLEFPVELIKQMGWDESTLLEWMIDEETEEVYIQGKIDAGSSQGKCG